MRIFLAIGLVATLSLFTLADGPGDNQSTNVRPIPPLGDALTDDQERSLAAECVAVRQAWSTLIQAAKTQVEHAKKWQVAQRQRHLDELQSLAPEVLVFPRAVEMTIEFQQFYKEQDVDAARRLIEEAKRRIAVAKESTDWFRVVGINNADALQLIVGGYESRIDGSYQPYALVIPSGVIPGDQRPRRLDIWFHGRGETLSEVSFLAKGQVSAGQYTPSDTFVLHPYGRYSNAFKFAGEIDVLEARDYLRGRIAVDDQRISVRGFSMGGAACWQFATHYSDQFFAANPGAGFSETPQFLSFFQKEDVTAAPDYQKTLWRWYDCPFWSRNLIHCPTVAYSGEIDRQKQAADVMEESLAEHNIDLVHVIGPQTGHKIHPDSKTQIDRRMNRLAASVTAQVPFKVDLTTQTLRYNRMHWVRVEGLDQHWATTRVNAQVINDSDSVDSDSTVIKVSTENVSRLRLCFEAGQWPGEFPQRPTVIIDETQIQCAPVRSDLSWEVTLEREQGSWQLLSDDDSQLRKRPGLQGPIDDAFMDSFLFVLPSGTSRDAAFQEWCESEMAHAQMHWRKHFRGDVRSVQDDALTNEQIRSHHLILFGDKESNSVIRRILDGLPIEWESDSISIGSHTVSGSGLAPVLVYPNPVNPNRYVVLNSGFTFREYDYLNNARQTPKLPDWAIVDVKEGATTRDPGIVKAAGFFNEAWKP